ncbi:hypothetical protein BKA62DRAFT_775598 [Auriculariales sp. MPI-PUGE-AT-0066]|nr:hypothetical protein BKA62DRAFT_775598 [Auriculariales sp. MPI-PUGE-AT-0066]
MMNTSVSGQGQQYYQELISKLNLRHSALRAIRIEAQAEQSRVAQAEAKNLALTAVALKYRLQRHTGQNRGSRHGIASGTSRTVVDLLQDTHQETARVLLKAEEISKNAQLLASYRKRLATLIGFVKEFEENVLSAATCRVCFYQPAETILVPCGHSLCPGCLTDHHAQSPRHMFACPLCRSPIDYGSNVPVLAIRELVLAVQEDA